MLKKAIINSLALFNIISLFKLQLKYKKIAFTYIPIYFFLRLIKVISLRDPDLIGGPHVPVPGDT